MGEKKKGKRKSRKGRKKQFLAFVEVKDPFTFKSLFKINGELDEVIEILMQKFL